MYELPLPEVREDGALPYDCYCNYIGDYKDIDSTARVVHSSKVCGHEHPYTLEQYEAYKGLKDIPQDLVGKPVLEGCVFSCHNGRRFLIIPAGNRAQRWKSGTEIGCGVISGDVYFQRSSRFMRGTMSPDESTVGEFMQFIRDVKGYRFWDYLEGNLRDINHVYSYRSAVVTNEKVGERRLYHHWTVDCRYAVVWEIDTFQSHTVFYLRLRKDVTKDFLFDKMRTQSETTGTNDLQTKMDALAINQTS